MSIHKKSESEWEIHYFPLHVSKHILFEELLNYEYKEKQFAFGNRKPYRKSSDLGRFIAAGLIFAGLFQCAFSSIRQFTVK